MDFIKIINFLNLLIKINNNNYYNHELGHLQITLEYDIYYCTLLFLSLPLNFTIKRDHVLCDKMVYLWVLHDGKG